jgi:uncharacterized membrane protein
MNTVFKLYYQAWVLLALASAFGAFYLWHTLKRGFRAAWAFGFALLFALSMVYPALAVPSRTNNFEANSDSGIPTLDGWHWVRRYYPDDYAAIEFLRQTSAPNSVILEAVGDQYSFYNRVSVATGLPTILGWGGHELQWRGDYDEAGPRERDVETIYKTFDARQALELLEKYGVDYVIVGSLERDKYQLGTPMIEKFAKIGELVFNEGSMRIYRIGGAREVREG